MPPSGDRNGVEGGQGLCPHHVHTRAHHCKLPCTGRYTQARTYTGTYTGTLHVTRWLVGWLRCAWGTVPAAGSRWMPVEVP